MQTHTIFQTAPATITHLKERGALFSDKDCIFHLD
jgi:hypothetical protein